MRPGGNVTGQMTFGIRLPTSGPFAAPARIRETAALAESLGFDTVWVNDHIAWPSRRRTHFSAGTVEAVADQRPDFYESLTTAAFVAGMTQRIKVGVAGLVLPWRDPRVLGKQLGTLHEMSGGRLIPALAIGRFEDEFNAQQVPYTKRGKITDEYLACLAALLGPDPVTSFRGTWVTIKDAEYFPKPKGLPLWICGMGSRAMRRVVRFGRGWLPSPMTPEELATRIRLLGTLMTTEGRSIDEIARGMETFTCIAETDEAARAIAGATLHDRFGDAARGASVSLVGSPVTITERIRQYAEAGLTHCELKFICHTPQMMQEMVQRYAEAVTPNFR